ncbi:hypothetical protein Tco_0129235 [Tanacetum coccineum]
METSKPLMKDENAEDVDVHLYRSMIGSLIIFRYLKGQPKLGLWYPKDSPFDLEAYTDSDYAGASLDRKSTTGGCQFLGSRLISWQCKKQTIVANSTTEAEYVAAASCCRQVLWIQNQMLDYGYNFMNTKIFIDNESTICIVKNPVFHSKTKHIEIRHHFIIDSNETKLIQMSKIHTDHNVADLHTKAFDVDRFQYLIAIKSGNSNFWQTATVSTLDNGEMEITATINGKVKIVTEASIRRHLKLEDSDGISNLPTTEIFEQLALMGTYIAPTLTQKLFSNMRASKGYTRVDIPLFPTMLVQGPIFQGEGSTVPTNVAIEAASTGVDIRHGGAATTVTSLDVVQDSGNIDKTPSMPHDSPLPRVYTLGSDEGRMQHNELMDLVTKLSYKVVALEIGLQHTKKVYGTAFTKLIKKVKKLEKTVKTRQARRKARIVVSDDEEDLEDPSKQGRKIAEIDSNPEIFEVYTTEKGVSTAKTVSTAGASVSTASASSAKDKGKAIMEEAKTIQNKTKVQEEASSFNIEEWDDIQARVKADEEFAQRLQSEEREMYSEAEKARLLVELINERKRYFTVQRAEERRNKPLRQARQGLYMSQNYQDKGMMRVHTFVPMESESEREISELAAGSSKRDAEELVQESSKRQKTRESLKPVEEPKNKEEEELFTLKELGSTRRSSELVSHIEVYQFFDDILKPFDREDLVKLWSLVKEKFTSTKPTEDKEREIWVELKRLFEPDTDDELWKLKKHIHDITWRLYNTCGVHHVSTKDEINIYMLVEREYPLSRGVLTHMLVAKPWWNEDKEDVKENSLEDIMQVEKTKKNKMFWIFLS